MEQRLTKKGGPTYMLSKRIIFGLSKLSHLRKNGRFKVEFGTISAVDVNPNTIESRFQGLFGSRVQHFLHDGRVIRNPCNQNKLGGGSSIGCLEIEIDQCIAWFVVIEFIAKILKRIFLGAFGFGDNGCLFFNFVTNVTKLFTLTNLEGLEINRDIVCNSHTGRLENKREDTLCETYIMTWGRQRASGIIRGC